MKYIALIYSAETLEPPYGSPEFNAYLAEYQAANETYARDKVLVVGEALNGVSTATTVRIRGGKVETMDGPFAETKEQLGGFYLFDCENLDEAIRYAAMIPTARHGAIEVRPVMSFG